MVNVSNIFGARPLAELIEENLNKLIADYSLIAIKLAAISSLQHTASMLLIVFGEFAKMSIDCGEIPIYTTTSEGKIETNLKQFLGLSKVTWCALANSALTVAKTYLLIKLMGKLDEQYSAINISDDLKLSEKLRETITKMLVISSTRGGACAVAVYLFLQNGNSLLDESESLLEKAFRYGCSDYYRVLKNYLEVEKKCKDGEILEMWKKQCENSLKKLGDKSLKISETYLLPDSCKEFFENKNGELKPRQTICKEIMNLPAQI